MWVPLGQKVRQRSAAVSEDQALCIAAVIFWVDFGLRLRPSWCWRSLVPRRRNQVKESFASFSAEQTGSVLESPSKPFAESPRPRVHHVCALDRLTVKGNRWGYPQDGALTGPRWGGPRDVVGKRDSWKFKDHFLVFVLGSQQRPLLRKSPTLTEEHPVDPPHVKGADQRPASQADRTRTSASHIGDGSVKQYNRFEKLWQFKSIKTCLCPLTQ